MEILCDFDGSLWKKLINLAVNPLMYNVPVACKWVCVCVRVCVCVCVCVREIDWVID